jgi:ribonuclease R
VRPLSGEGEDIYLPRNEAQRAIDGDLVLVRLERKGARTSGRLLKVLERRRRNVVGVYEERGHGAYVLPRDPGLPSPVRVPKSQIARPGDMVKVHLSPRSTGLELVGEVAGSVGKPGDSSAEVLSIAFAQGFDDEFPPPAMDEASSVPSTASATGGRRDLHNMQLVTIDGEDARDFDDAVFAEPVNGGWRLVVAIADVAEYVGHDSGLDREALHRATSVYLPNRVLPMLPERLSNGICSLVPQEDRLCLVAEMVFDRGGQRRSYQLYPAVMRSAARCTYNEVQAVLEGKEVPGRSPFRERFVALQQLARALRQMRERRGAIDFDLPERRVVVDEQGNPIRIEKRERKESHRIIEECMLAANEAVASFFQERDLPTVYRYHGEPDEEKLAAFADLARAHGFKLPANRGLSSKELNLLLERLEDHPERAALNQLLLRSMMQAVYSARSVGHYGLAAERYLHFTSPIRRYPDLVVHRLLKALWADGVPGRKQRDEQLEELDRIALRSSERERAAMEVERSVSAYYSALLMKDRVGEEFDATVSGLAEFGFFVQLDQPAVEGLVKADSLPGRFKLQKELHQLTFGSGLKVRIGQRTRVKLVSVNLQRRLLDFELVRGPSRRARPITERGTPKDGRAPSPQR